MSVWWKRHSGANSNRQDNQVECVSSNNSPSITTSPGRNNAVTNKAYMGIVNNPSVQGVEAQDVQGVEAPMSYVNLKEKEAQLDAAPPSYEAHYYEKIKD